MAYLYNRYTRKRESTYVSARFPLCVVEEMEQICAQSGIDLSTYIVQALVHYVESMARQGDLEVPNFLDGKYRYDPMMPNQSVSIRRRVES